MRVTEVTNRKSLPYCAVGVFLGVIWGAGSLGGRDLHSMHSGVLGFFRILGYELDPAL